VRKSSVEREDDDDDELVVVVVEVAELTAETLICVLPAIRVGAALDRKSGGFGFEVRHQKVMFLKRLGAGIQAL
jgi:hypothetical protein